VSLRCICATQQATNAYQTRTGTKRLDLRRPELQDSGLRLIAVYTVQAILGRIRERGVLPPRGPTLSPLLGSPQAAHLRRSRTTPCPTSPSRRRRSPSPPHWCRTLRTHGTTRRSGPCTRRRCRRARYTSRRRRRSPRCSCTTRRRKCCPPRTSRWSSRRGCTLCTPGTPARRRRSRRRTCTPPCPPCSPPHKYPRSWHRPGTRGTGCTPVHGKGFQSREGPAYN
jgi:hypothetical protein